MLPRARGRGGGVNLAVMGTAPLGWGIDEIEAAGAGVGAGKAEDVGARIELVVLLMGVAKLAADVEVVMVADPNGCMLWAFTTAPYDGGARAKWGVLLGMEKPLPAEESEGAGDGFESAEPCDGVGTGEAVKGVWMARVGVMAGVAAKRRAWAGVPAAERA